MRRRGILVEAAVDTLEHAIAAADAGVHRLELCGSLHLGGITPDAALLKAALRRVSIPVFVMVRPRGGDFVYAPEEIEKMLLAIEMVRGTSAAGIVTGALTPDFHVDLDTLRQLVDAAGDLAITFHRAFDRRSDGYELKELIELGVTRILTSGGKSSALVGADRIAALVRSAGEEMTIVAGGFVRARNVREVVRRTGVTEVHARFTDASEMRNFVLAAGQL
jgi:copper homeostasis protein